MARLDIKGANLIKGVHFEGLRVIGNPEEYARKYYSEGADEILYMDAVASLYGRSKLPEIVAKTAHNIFIPMTVGGGIRSVDDVRDLLQAGADKVAINTAAVRSPKLISEVAKKYGSQCIVLSIEAKKQGKDHWEVYTDCGREHSNLDVLAWAKKGVDLGAGEILLTSIDMEGTRKGYDIELTKMVSDSVSIPVIASGGMGKPTDLVDVVQNGQADAVAMADILHYGRYSIAEIRKTALESNIKVRKFE